MLKFYFILFTIVLHGSVLDESWMENPEQNKSMGLDCFQMI